MSPPDRWEKYEPIGNVIAGTKFIAFKVPLKKELQEKLPPNERFCPQDVIERVKGKGKILGLVIDVSYSDKYYHKGEFCRQNIEHEKIYTEGHNVPKDAVIYRFFDVVEKFSQRNKGDETVIGVHCTHGVNRTGYIVCRYMVERLGIEPNTAISAFATARGHPIERENYLEDLLTRQHNPHYKIGNHPPVLKGSGKKKKHDKDIYKPWKWNKNPYRAPEGPEEMEQHDQYQLPPREYGGHHGEYREHYVDDYHDDGPLYQWRDFSNWRSHHNNGPPHQGDDFLHGQSHQHRFEHFNPQINHGGNVRGDWERQRYDQQGQWGGNGYSRGYQDYGIRQNLARENKKSEKFTSRDQVKTTVKQKPCIYCTELHNPANCSSVTDYNRRLAVIKEKRLCFNCLGTHKSSDCKSKFRCRHCSKKHHTSICTEQLKVPSSTQAETKSGKDAKHGAVVSVVNTSKQDDVTEIGSAQSRSDVLLKTAIAPVWFDSQASEANILFDEGAQRSFMTEKLASQLNLKVCDSEVIQLSTFGESNEKQKRLPKVSVFIESTDGCKIPIDVLVVPKIAGPMKNLNTNNLSKLKYSHNLRLAHPVSSNDVFKISLLIGADFYWNFVEDEVHRGDGPAVKSKVG